MDALKPMEGIAPARKKRRSHSIKRWGPSLLTLLLIAGCAFEVRTASLQSQIFTRWARDLTYDLGPGPSSDIRFPRGGPYDKRLGYSQLPVHISALTAHNFSIVRQASWSPQLQEFADRHGYAVYTEKETAGLTLNDRTGAPFYRARYPERTYEDFDTIPQLVVDSLRFIEDRLLLAPGLPHRNPAVDWKRLAVVTTGQVGGLLDPTLRRGGASTLATQIEKFRHYPDGLTRSINDKFAQMVAASTRSYLDGPETFGAQQRIISTYLNSTPLSSRPGHGEIIGISEGLWAWYGTDPAEASAILADNEAVSPRKALVFKQLLSLLLAQRRPSYYLMQGGESLEALTRYYLYLLSDVGIVGTELRDAALRAKLEFASGPPSPAPISFVARKAATSIRMDLLRMLGTSSLYDLDRLDVGVRTTFDAAVQERVSDLLARLGEREQVKSLGLTGSNLLGEDDPSQVSYSVVVYERGSDRNFVRVHADSLNRPFDLNSGAKLILGSTAKIRTLITYLDIVARLHNRYEATPPAQLSAVATKAEDPLSRWATSYLARTADRDLQSMLNAAMQRRYSASAAERFFTGGGTHSFGNFEKSDDARNPTVEEALVHSINLAFIRIMRDIRDFYIAEANREFAQGDNSEDDLRQTYLRRFADQEGRTYLNRFYDEFQGRTTGEMLSKLAALAGRAPSRLTIVFRSLFPDAPMTELRDFLKRELPEGQPSERAIEDLYKTYSPDRYSLVDRAYRSRVHPLQLWLAGYLRDHPGATRSQVLDSSEPERQIAYEWLFQTRSTHKKDVRIRIVSEQDAFERILQDWRKQGYPFSSLVPSLATAIGSSGDRPEALAQLMGILLNDGVHLPTVEIERLDFATSTPYETQMALVPPVPKRVFAPEVARTARYALLKVVSQGTGVRFRDGIQTREGSSLPVGGKTGTGDNRFKTFDGGQRLVESRVVDRTATFVFFFGDRFYGTVTAYVAGSDAGKYRFTSALAVQLLKSLLPDLQPLMDDPEALDLARTQTQDAG